MTISKHTYAADVVYTQGTLPASVLMTDNGGNIAAWEKPWGNTTRYVRYAGGRSGGPYSWALILETGIATGYVTHNITGLTVGRKYTVSVWLQPSNVPTVTLEDTSLEVFPGRWEQISTSFTATATTRTIRLTSISGVAYSTTLQFDDLKVTAHPYVLPPAVITLPLVEGTVALDESWAPYASASLTLPLPDKDVLARLDPRAKARIRITTHQSFGTSQPLSAFNGATLGALSTRYAGQTLLGISTDHGTGYNPEGVRPPTSRVLDLCVRSRIVDRVQSTVTLYATSDEGLLMDFAPDTARTSGATVRGAVNLALSSIGAVLQPGTSDGSVDSEATVWEPGVSGWDFTSPLVDAAGLRLFCDEQRRWWLVEPLQASDAALYLSAENLTQAEDMISRDEGWFDAVTVKYTWVDAAGLQVVRYDVAAPNGYSKMETVTLDRKWPGSGAAAAMLARARGRGQITSAEAVSNYDSEPGAFLRLSLPGSAVQTGVVSRVEWRLGSDDMTVQSRDLADTPPRSWLARPFGETWDSQPVGVPWVSASPLNTDEGSN